MLSLYIGSNKVWIQDTSGSTFQVFPVYYKKDKEVHELRLSNSLPLLDDVEIFFQWWRYFIRLPVSPELRTAILNFMLFKHIPQNDSYDCYSFACEYAKVGAHNKRHLFDFWKLKPLKRRPKVGQVIIMFARPAENNIHFSHAAIYLGFGRYLSVWGGGGQLEVATLKDMKRDFKAPLVFLGTPR